MTFRSYLGTCGMKQVLCHSKITFLADSGQKSRAPQEQFDARAEEYVASRERPLRLAIDLLIAGRVTHDEGRWVAFWGGDMKVFASRDAARSWLLGAVLADAGREGGLG